MNTKKEHGKIDWMITLVPLAIVIALCVLFFFAPEQSNAVLSQIRFFFGDTFGTYYLVIGLGIFILSLYIAGSKYGNIVLGEQSEKPKYSFFAWGSMMFTCGLAADILFYSFSEWVLYATDPHLAEMGSIQDWAGVYPLFHWSFIPWGFYLVLAVAFGFILLILLPIALLFAESSMNNLQSVSIVAAFPIGAVIVMITASFMKDAKVYLSENFQ